MTADFSELDHLEADLRRAGVTAGARLYPVLKKGADNITRDARESASGLTHAPHYPQAITYDVEILPGVVTAEVGPDKDRRQGALGNLIEYGSANNPPHNDLGKALDREVPVVEQFVTQIGGAIL